MTIILNQIVIVFVVSFMSSWEGARSAVLSIAPGTTNYSVKIFDDVSVDNDETNRCGKWTAEITLGRPGCNILRVPNDISTTVTGNNTVALSSSSLNVSMQACVSALKKVNLVVSCSLRRERIVTWRFWPVVSKGIDLIAHKDHFYTFVSSLANWSISLCNNQPKLFGMTPYLATVTSKEEDILLGQKGPRGALCGTDEGHEGIWMWMCGPEKGKIFYYQKNKTSVMYTNWAPNEPNNYLGENYLHFWTNGGWNDFNYQTLGTVTYFCEYGDNPVDAVSNFTDDTVLNQDSYYDFVSFRAMTYSYSQEDPDVTMSVTNQSFTFSETWNGRDRINSSTISLSFDSNRNISHSKTLSADQKPFSSTFQQTLDRSHLSNVTVTKTSMTRSASYDRKGSTRTKSLPRKRRPRTVTIQKPFFTYKLSSLKPGEGIVFTISITNGVWNEDQGKTMLDQLLVSLSQIQDNNTAIHSTQAMFLSKTDLLVNVTLNTNATKFRMNVAFPSQFVVGPPSTLSFIDLDVEVALPSPPPPPEVTLSPTVQTASKVVGPTTAVTTAAAGVVSPMALTSIAVTTALFANDCNSGMGKKAAQSSSWSTDPAGQIVGKKYSPTASNAILLLILYVIHAIPVSILSFCGYDLTQATAKCKWPGLSVLSTSFLYVAIITHALEDVMDPSPHGSSFGVSFVVLLTCGMFPVVLMVWWIHDVEEDAAFNAKSKLWSSVTSRQACERYGMLFEGYRQSKTYFVAVEFAYIFVISISVTIHRVADCDSQHGFTLATLFGMCLVRCVLHPRKVMILNVSEAIVPLLQGIGVALSIQGKDTSSLQLTIQVMISVHGGMCFFVWLYLYHQGKKLTEENQDVTKTDEVTIEMKEVGESANVASSTVKVVNTTNSREDPQPPSLGAYDQVKDRGAAQTKDFSSPKETNQLIMKEGGLKTFSVDMPMPNQKENPLKGLFAEKLRALHRKYPLDYVK
eukprot:PhF_6_TR692/c0_g1_i1/m.1102